MRRCSPSPMGPRDRGRALLPAIGHDRSRGPLPCAEPEAGGGTDPSGGDGAAPLRMALDRDAGGQRGMALPSPGQDADRHGGGHWEEDCESHNRSQSHRNRSRTVRVTTDLRVTETEVKHYVTGCGT